MKKTLFFLLSVILTQAVLAQQKYILHSSQLVLGCGSDNRTQILSASDSRTQKLSISKLNDGTCNIVCEKADGSRLYMTKDGSWNTYFKSAASGNASIWTIEQTSGSQYVKIKCKDNSRYLGTDATTAGSNVFCDKDGNDAKHLWYLADSPTAVLLPDTLNYIVNPAVRRQAIEGWGVSLCWWARMCGGWSDKKIDQLVDWLVSPTGLNFNIFRYNIGGGDDPLNRHCDLHHMGRGKGLRAEMEGFQDERGGDFIWSRDEGQRKIMLKIKEKRPDAIFEAFSNSCPWWMTYSGCCAGNVDGGKDNLKPEYYEDFANYLVEVCKHYKEEYGIEFRTLEPFNESMTSFWYANGPQEGCHFDVQSQINFIKVLHPILQKSGLNTVISASDETAVYLGIDAIKKYKSAGIMDLVGQWNTHTYTADDDSRSKIGSLARQYGKRQWMSEVGSGGSGLQGNLNMAQKLMDDVRYMLPDAWVDWQYVEENNDQWCMVQASFSNESSAKKVKNYYVRQHFSRFIPAGYQIVTSLNKSTLCALSPDETELVLVMLNATAMKSIHKASLRFCLPEASAIKGYITSEGSSLGTFRDFKLDEDGTLNVNLPALSIVTLTIPVSGVARLNLDNMPGKALLVPQPNTAVAMTGTTKLVSIESNTGSNAQVWDVIDNENGTYSLMNQDSLYLTYLSTAFGLSAKARRSVNTQSFTFDPVDDYLYRIKVGKTTKYVDLQNSVFVSGTTVGSNAYNNNGDNITRHWMLVGIEAAQDVGDGIQAVEGNEGTADQEGRTAMYDLSGRRINQVQKGVNVIRTADGTTRKILVR